MIIFKKTLPPKKETKEIVATKFSAEDMITIDEEDDIILDYSDEDDISLINQMNESKKVGLNLT